MEKKFNLNRAISSMEEKTKGLLNNAIQSADQNDDGKFDLSDVSMIAGNVSDALSKGTQMFKEGAEEKKKILELKMLQPIFSSNLDEANFLMPKFIRVADRDKKYADSEVCQGSIGHNVEQNGFKYITIFRDSISEFGLSFHPDSESEFYYVDPTDRDKYIALDEYFNYLKIARVSELERIAQDLGAKYFKVTYKEEQTSFSETKAAMKVELKPFGKNDAEHEASQKKFSSLKVESEMSFPGHEPNKPQIKYLQRDASIQTLIEQRMNPDSPLMHKTYMLQMSNSSGMKEKDAIKIDGVLKGFKYSGNATVASEAKNESRRYLEYEIKF